MWLAFPSTGKSKEIQWTFLQEWAVQAVTEPIDLGKHTNPCNHGLHFKQRNKAMEPGYPVTTQSSPPFALDAGL